MKTRSIDRVRVSADELSLDINILEMPASTRTAEEAASACGCTVSRIVKSLIFQRRDGDGLVLLLIAGDNQADLDLAGRVIGAPLERADAKRVREETGFAIGGVAPIGHLNAPEIYIDPDLLEHDVVWAAAGAPNAVFSVDPAKLAEATGARALVEPG
jgi:prolyl-tRNA editing enzyme YbaK/EbsC (Cys-tRNA(Pro) deacylase)